MNYILGTLLAVFFLLMSRCCSAADEAAGENALADPVTGTYRNPLDVTMADPFVLLHKGVYYLYGTYDASVNSGLVVFTSSDLVNWKNQGLAFEKTSDTWSQSHFWGPEVVYTKGEFYMYFNASPNSNPRDRPFNMRLCIAKSKSPLGPFTEIKAPFYSPRPPDEAIDQHVFIDDDGRAYLYFTRVTVGRNEIRVVRLKDNMVEFDGEPILCVRPKEPWESHQRGNHVVAEGAYVLKRGGYYYLTYTANHFLDPNYCIGYAVSSSPLGPWKKYEGNPVLKKTDRISGPGNGMVVPSPDGSERFIVYHVHNSLDRVLPRKLAIDRIRFESREDGPDVIVIDGPTHTPQPMPSGSGGK